MAKKKLTARQRIAHARVAAAGEARDALKSEITDLRESANGKGLSQRATKQVARLEEQLKEARREVIRARVCLRRSYGALG